MRIRPVTTNDHSAILSLAKAAGIGMTSLPADAEVLENKISKAVKSFAGENEHAGDESYLFVLEDTEYNGKVIGTCGIKSHIGLRQPFYSYKLSTITQSCKEIEVYNQQQLLSVVNDYTGSSEIGSLFLLPEYRRDRIGRFLSRMRFLFMAQFPERIDERVIAEVRGIHRRDGTSPFYNSIAKHFFQMEFADADYTNATKGNQFIADLMPKYPIYVSLLSPNAKEVIGQAYHGSEPAKAMIEREGFRYNGYLDIFDGGPTLEVARDDILTVKDSNIAEIASIKDYVEGKKHFMMTDNINSLYACVGRVLLQDDGRLQITSRVAKLLEVSVGDSIRYVKE